MTVRRPLPHRALLIVVLGSALLGLAAFTPAAHGDRRAPRPALTFLAIGDWGRDGNYRQREVAHQMDSTGAAWRARFVISTGDNFYDNGLPSVTSERWRKSYEDIYTGPALQVPWYVVLGNHDYRGNPQAQIDYTKRSKRWRMPARYYMRTEKLPGGGKLDLFFLDTNVFIENYRREKKKYADVAEQSPDAQLRWLEQELARSKAEWRVVVGHHPVFSEGASHGDTPVLVEKLKPLLERHRVHLYLNGHDHDLQHIVVSGIDYVTSGAGSLTRPTNSGPDTRFALGKTAGFVAFAVDRDSLRASFIDFNGHERYRYSRGR